METVDFRCGWDRARSSVRTNTSSSWGRLCVRGEGQGMPGKSPYLVLRSAVNLTLISNGLFKKGNKGT